MKKNQNEELVKDFIGVKYNYFKAKRINLYALIFSYLYLAYRKMYLYSFISILLIVLISVIFKNIEYSLIINIFLCLFINKIYLKYARRQVTKIISKNDKDYISIIKKKGRTSIASSIILLSITWILLSIIFITYIYKTNASYEDNVLLDYIYGNSKVNDTSGEAIENAFITSQDCFLYRCRVSLNDDFDKEYLIRTDNNQFFLKLDNYINEIDYNAYYKIINKKYVITGYKIFNKNTHEEITNVSNENELREKLNLFKKGINTSKFKLLSINSSSVFKRRRGIIKCYEFTLQDESNKTYYMYYLKNNINDYKLNESYIIKFNLNINSDGEDTYEILDIKKE